MRQNSSLKKAGQALWKALNVLEGGKGENPLVLTLNSFSKFLTLFLFPKLNPYFLPSHYIHFPVFDTIFRYSIIFITSSLPLVRPFPA